MKAAKETAMQYFFKILACMLQNGAWGGIEELTWEEFNLKKRASSTLKFLQLL